MSTPHCGIVRQFLALFIVSVPLFLTTHLTADEYRVTITADTDEQDQIGVRIELPPLVSDTNVFVFPVTVPGTYEYHYWWRLVREFRAYTASGHGLMVRRTADSQFVIPKNTAFVEYRLHDSFDDRDDRVNIFHPTGTSFQGDSVFVFNHGGIVGYVYGQQRLPFFVRVNRSPAIQTFTALHVTTRGLDYDEYFAPSYDALVDGPALVCRADTARFTVKGTDVLVAICGSKRNKPLATVYAQALQKATNAVAVFLPSMPVSSYAFLIYLWDADTVNVKRSKYAQGALEHSLSSLYFWRFSELPRGIEEIAAHEFLHILLPLHVHSKEIDAFDYRYPKMSKHLWLYEGVTEYFAHQSQLRGAVTTEEQFIQQLSANAKIISYLPNTFAFTDFSENVLSPENQKLYPAIYQIGPLNALLLDILLRTESSGSLGLLELVYKLMEKYGPSIPFDDDSLFVEIERITNPAVREYLEKYVGNTSPLPLQSYLSTIGLEYLDSTKVSVLTFGVEFNQEVSSPDSIVIEPGDVNPLGVQRGDVLRKVNGTTMKPGSWHILQRLVNNTSQDPITITVERNGTLLDLAAPPVQTLEIVRHVIRSVPQPTEKQRSLRRLVFYGKS